MVRRREERASPREEIRSFSGLRDNDYPRKKWR
jgi:hypothetical protein